MTDITTIQDQIRARLAEVEQQIEPLRLEADQLRSLTALFGGRAATAAPRAASSQRPRAKPPTAATEAPAKRVRRASSGGAAKRGRPIGSGNRAQQAVARIVDHPGITASELATEMGIKPNYLYRVLPRLEREAKVIKQGRGYHPAPDAQTTTPTSAQPVAA